MEDIKAYIESGILELYVLGDVSQAEKLEVEAMAAKHPAIKAELEEIEKSLELYAKDNAVEPAEGQRDKILNSLLTNLGDDRNFTTKSKQQEVSALEEMILKEMSQDRTLNIAALANLLRRLVK